MAMMKPFGMLLSLVLILSLTACDQSISEDEIGRVYRAFVATLAEGEGFLSEPVSEVSSASTPAVVQEKKSAWSVTQAAVTPALDGNAACNQAVSGVPVDITIPDGTRMRPGQPFTKTWRLVNAGTCEWGAGYSAVWFSGAMFTQNKTQFLRTAVSPGESVDITIEMTAPRRAGVHQSNWKLSDPKANLFGIGPGGESPFWVRIEVIAEASTPTPEIVLTATIPAAIYTGGEIELLLNDRVDLDSGEINTEGSDDIIFHLTEDGEPVLSAQDGTRLVIYGESLPVERDCQALAVASEPVALEGLSEGYYLCFRTDQALPGYVRLIYADLEENLLTLEFLTWAVP